MARIRRTAFVTLLLVIAIGGGTILWAQNATLPASVMAAAPADVVDPNAVRLLVGRSTVIDVGTAVSRVSLTSADIADALVTSPNQLLINGKMPGTISMFVWDRTSSNPRRYEIIVQRDLARLSEQLRQLFPGEAIDAHSNGKNIVLSGSVTNKDVIEKAVNVASGYVDKRDEVVALLQIQAGAPSNQVLLRVRFAEVSRSAMTDLGVSLFTPGYKDRWVGRVGTQQFGNSLPDFESDGDKTKMVFSDYLNLFLFDAKNQLGTVIKALQTKGQFQSLAEPNLVAESGKEASFLAGGEFPVPIAQGSGANMAISVMFKEYGIRLTFTPTVIGNRVHLKVRPEVSTLDFGNAVNLNGFRIPALSTRRTETELELESGQTFAIAGLMDNQVSSTMQKIPGIGDIPILGLLFRSKAAQKSQTELVVMITPEILPNNSRGVTPNLPRTPEQFLPPLTQQQTVAPKAPAFAAERALSTTTAAAIPSAPNQQGQLSSSGAPALQTSDAPALEAVAVPIPGAAVKPLTENELKTIEKNRRAEAEKAEKAAREQLEADRRADLKERERQKKVSAEQEKLAKEQAKRDAEAAKRAAEAAKKAEEAAKKQSELDRDYRKSLDAAAAKLAAAKAAYNAELARSQQQ